VTGTIPAPRNILVSYHYFKGYDLDKFAGLRVIGDSGAFSAKHQGAEVTTKQLARWVVRWRHRLCWAAALDVIGDAETTRRNWHELVDTYGIPGVPTIHFGCDPALMNYYVHRGVDFIGLGGLVGRSGPAQMRWLVKTMIYARTNHLNVRFHGWGVAGTQALQLPFFSVDSSGWGGGYRYGHLTLRDPDTGKVHNVNLNGNATYDPTVARLLSKHYGVTPSEVATSGPHNRLLMVRLSALSVSVLEQQFRRAHRGAPIPAPTWGQFSSANTGPHLHLADTNQPEKGLEVVAGMAVPDGPHMHLVGTGQCRDLAVAGPHLHLAEANSEHLQIATTTMNGVLE
jgi:hypothetical protein